MGSSPTSPVVLLMLSFRSFLRKTVDQNQQLSNLLFLFLDWALNVLKISRVEYKNTDLLVINTYKEKLSLSTRFLVLDCIFVLFSSVSSGIFSNLKNIFSMNIKTKQLNTSGFYIFNNNFNVFSINQLYLYGVRSV